MHKQRQILSINVQKVYNKETGWWQWPKLFFSHVIGRNGAVNVHIGSVELLLVLASIE